MRSLRYIILTQMRLSIQYGFRIPNFLLLCLCEGIFSYFLTRKPTREELVSTEDILVMTSQGQNWDPNSDVYALNEENMIDWEGNMIYPRHRT